MFSILVCTGACVSSRVCVCTLNGPVGRDLAPYYDYGTCKTAYFGQSSLESVKSDQCRLKLFET